MFGIKIRKMKNSLIILLLLFITLPALAQKGEHPQYDKEKLEAAKVAFITQRLDLTPAQAEKFWPLYNQYSESKRKLMKNVYTLLKNNEEEITDDKAEELLGSKFDTEQKILDLDKEFFKGIIKVISPVQALKLSEVNKDFTRHIYRMHRYRKDRED